MTGASHLFVTPPLDGPATGGTLYNRNLIAALRSTCLVRHGTLDELDSALAHGPFDYVWIDSLHLASVAPLRARLDRSTQVCVLLHYLPTLLREPAPTSPDALNSDERDALTAANLVLVPSLTLGGLVQSLFANTRVMCVPPGVDDRLAEPAHTPEAGSCVMVCNVTENKGVYPLLSALASSLQDSDRIDMHVIGSLTAEVAYAQRCARLVTEHPQLSSRVHLRGALAHAAVLDALARCALFVSASRMESYGMALAEARAQGVPILARAAGHVAEHVAASAGGELVADESELARSVLALMRRPEELARRTRLARAQRVWRSWRHAASEFARQTRTVRRARTGALQA